MLSLRHSRPYVPFLDKTLNGENDDEMPRHTRGTNLVWTSGTSAAFPPNRLVSLSEECPQGCSPSCSSRPYYRHTWQKIQNLSHDKCGNTHIISFWFFRLVQSDAQVRVLLHVFVINLFPIWCCDMDVMKLTFNVKPHTPFPTLSQWGHKCIYAANAWTSVDLCTLSIILLLIYTSGSKICLVLNTITISQGCWECNKSCTHLR